MPNFLMDLENFEGKKSYIVAVAAAMYAIGGYVAGYLDLNQALATLLGAGGLGALAAKVNRFFDSMKGLEGPQDE